MKWNQKLWIACHGQFKETKYFLSDVQKTTGMISSWMDYHWKFTKSSHKGLDGIRKFGTCHGYFVCKNNKCTKYTTENVCNTIDFQRDFKGHTCRSCGFYAH